MNHFLAIVPARGGSKGVVRKNMRELSGKPLIGHTIDCLRLSGTNPRIVVSSDDEEILGWAALHGAECHRRPSYLADDESTISSVAVEVVRSLDWHGLVGVFQPTSPLRSPSSVRLALQQMESQKASSLSTVVRERHLFWLDETGTMSNVSPLFGSRVNRQFAVHKVLRETGSIQLVTSSALLAENSVVTANHSFMETHEAEADDIDTVEDLERVRRRLERGGIIFRVTANTLVGSGHLHHCLQLAEHLDRHEVLFLLKDCDEFAREMLGSRGWAWWNDPGLAGDWDLGEMPLPRVVVNDVLDTSAAEILSQRASGFRVVCIEDLGEGARMADWVVNALYPPQGTGYVGRVSTGARYATLRSEFHNLPAKQIPADGRKVLVTFGGTDPGNLASRVTRALAESGGFEVTVVLGAASTPFEAPPSVRVLSSVKNMAQLMFDSDVVVTAAGRTVYEAAAVGVPVISLAQNAREATHAHLNLDGGVMFLGLGVLVSDSTIVDTVGRLLGDRVLRAELSSRLKASIDLLGAQRIAAGIDQLLKGM